MCGDVGEEVENAGDPRHKVCHTLIGVEAQITDLSKRFS